MTTRRETKTLDQDRAEHAWNCILAVLNLKPDEKRQFGIQLKKLPTRIMAAGLGQALAFLEAKGYAEELRKALSDWIEKRRPLSSTEKDKRLLVRLIYGDADFQRYATAEVLTYLVWLVRFADAHNLTEGAQE